MRLILLMLGAFVLSALQTQSTLQAAEAPTQAQASEKANEKLTEKKVKYKSGKDVNFEELLIQGQLKRPEVTVVTGDDGMGNDGMLRLRQNFLDRLASDAGEGGTP